MADSTLSVTVRDTGHPCAPYQSTAHTFFLQIFHCDGKPLFWRGVNFGKPVPLELPGHGGGRIHGQFKVPSGCYLVRAIASCKNVITDWAWVNVGCDETVCVDLVPPSVIHCINRVIAGLQLGTVDPPEASEQTVAQLVPKEVQEAVEVLARIAERLPRDPQLPAAPTPDEAKAAVEEEARSDKDEDDKPRKKG
jgi:hypothetical protein